MKKLVFILLLIISISLLNAKPELLGLNFGDSSTKCKTILEKSGLTPSQTMKDEVMFTSTKQQSLIGADLFFNNDKLYSWTLQYQQMANEDYLVDVIYGKLVELYGEETDYDDEYEVYYWNFDDNSRYVEAGWNYDYSYYEVYYE